MKKSLLVFAMLFLAFNSYGQSLENYLKIALEKFNKGDNKGAVIESSKAINLNFEDSDRNNELFASCYILRAMSKFNLGDYGGTILDSTKAIDLFKIYLYNLAKSGVTSEEIYADKYVYLLADSFFYKSIALASKGEFNQALPYIDDAIKLVDERPDYFMSRGKIKIYIGQKESGCLDFSKAGELGAEDAYDYINENCN